MTPNQYHLVFALSYSLCFATSLSWPLDFLSRRSALQQAVLSTTANIFHPPSAYAYEDERKTVTVGLLSPKDSLGVQIYNTNIGGKPTVAIRNVSKARYPNLKEGMVVKDYASSETLIERIRSGPFPIELEFIDLAAGGDAFSDTGDTLVTTKDALDLAQKVDDNNGVPTPKYSIEVLQKPSSICVIQSRRLDVLEIVYEAFYRTTDNQRILYDSSSSRGTGLPYQMVLGSGDMITGVDQGLYDMCPGEARLLEIPRVLGYGNRALRTYRIPPNYTSLEWQIELISIDGTIRKDNNESTRDEREGRAM